MLLIGENLNIMSKKLADAFLTREPDPVRKMVEAEIRAGMDMLDVNIGPARKAGPEFMEWIVKRMKRKFKSCLCWYITIEVC